MILRQGIMACNLVSLGRGEIKKDKVCRVKDMRQNREIWAIIKLSASMRGVNC